MTTFDIAVIGAGFSGTMVAVNLARKSEGKLRIALIERGGAPGCGVAYGTTDNHHLLNVRAAQMGAFPDRIGDFYEWLQRHPDVWKHAKVTTLEPGSFVPRLVYGAYLQDILRQTQATFPTLETFHADITRIATSPTGYELHSATETVATTPVVVLALGNFPPGDSSTNQTVNPYAPEVYARLAEPGDVFLIGTGLTSLDLLVTMARTKAQGNIHLVSRGGLFPQVHHDVSPYPPFLDAENLPKTALSLLATVRREIRKAKEGGIAWQSVVDSLRPLNQKIWQSLPMPEQRKFLRRIRSYWDTHRHRCAADVMAARDKFIAEGRLIQHRGSFISMTDTPDGVAVTWKPSGAARTETITVHCAVSCTGPQSDCRKLDDPLVQDLLKSDLLAPDPLRIGADTTQTSALKNSKGETVPGLYTMGTWRKGKLYESVAVPELRGQAADLADTIIAERTQLAAAS